MLTSDAKNPTVRVLPSQDPSLYSFFMLQFALFLSLVRSIPISLKYVGYKLDLRWVFLYLPVQPSFADIDADADPIDSGRKFYMSFSDDGREMKSI